MLIPFLLCADNLFLIEKCLVALFKALFLKTWLIKCVKMRSNLSGAKIVKIKMAKNINKSKGPLYF